MSNTLELLRQGSVKDIYRKAGADTLEMVFSDRISVFDKPIPMDIPHKGQVLAGITEFWFLVAREMGVHTHFVRRVGPRSIEVRGVEVIHDYSSIRESTANYLIPIEFVSRYYVAGMLFDRLKSGEIQSTHLGFATNYVPHYGERLPAPLFETGTKLEPVDVFIPAARAKEMSAISDDDLQQVWETVKRLDAEIDRVCEVSGKLIHADGKKEFALDRDRRLMLVDTFGTPDEDRFWDADAYSRGECIELSKEHVRQYYRRIGYKDELYGARSQGLPEPPIPLLPQAEVARTSEVYVAIYELLTGRTFAAEPN